VTDYYVIDTNVWAMIDRPIADVETAAELACIEQCRQWLRNFINSEDRLVVDLAFKILTEYRGQIAPGGLPNQWLNQLETKPRDLRLVELLITFDRDGYAIVPDILKPLDRSDRKFAAVALAHDPRPTIVNAADTDWSITRAALEQAGLTVLELCPDYIREILDNR
jgi:hypothetical protein